MIVVDASVMVMALTSPTAQGDAARLAMLGDDDWAAPGHMPLEVLRTLHKAVLRNQLAAHDADAAAGALTAMQIRYVDTDDIMLRSVWAMRHNISVYDAAYLTVAVLNDAHLITFDARLAKAAAQTEPDVNVVLL
ncbi:type II toxin-antitoxin system VapC family toxin [Nocardia cyriacigeorgica]|uniref:type II toxin-antitoxin system VapC family toxin n=1 Tax=Nocardia cyriacigeorgica TaxID=135487 RepID=UPI001892EE55|nr:type II toxin-antitoxin system VapC family toxin [Nocardia cyriacigeorgica]MBF6100147.1 type II toxin-antitoxin system VapC family toxin [Nocardia cyriacigeorgica]MBF6159139.1 type II toxin-antitoxin system VapC family toxin [Nocardia cyriacigeorgica]MBF6198222.1 type II toxin-antitoxin system VapC family toxin [Nocardia cyriacigeorgica]MBF6315502.1 type II toxin-antitoxin system VapC family toxin [Nocardia cyriacigeorgica]MBF6342968.1 type II toxin-antitoxin system VapC family toxin [Nocar